MAVGEGFSPFFFFWLAIHSRVDICFLKTSAQFLVLLFPSVSGFLLPCLSSYENSSTPILCYYLYWPQFVHGRPSSSFCFFASTDPKLRDDYFSNSRSSGNSPKFVFPLFLPLHLATSISELV
ncbi:hypothetical protein DFJ73DRAFT_837669, partial [Zopfochytrium polystomum]